MIRRTLGVRVEVSYQRSHHCPLATNPFPDLAGVWRMKDYGAGVGRMASANIMLYRAYCISFAYFHRRLPRCG